MEHWAAFQFNKNEKLQFVCVCVDEVGVAQMFGRMFFRKCHNAQVPSPEYYPRGFGQLGCSGFVVVDDNKFVSKKTMSYLDYGERAFLDVEKILRERSMDVPAKEPEEKKDSSTPVAYLTSIQVPEATGLQDMDDEHQECTTALNILLQQPSTPHFREALAVLEEHFGHEEAMLAAKYGMESFSPLHSHKQDHERILNIARKELDRIAAC